MAQPSIPDPPTEDPNDPAVLRRNLVASIRKVCPPSVAADAEDIAQRALIKLLRPDSSGEEVRTFNASYLWRVATTSVIDEIRRRERRREVTLAAATIADIPAAAQPDPEREAASRAIGAAIRDCLARMTVDRRRAVTLRLVGHTVPEIARLLGWRAKQADNRVYRGMKDLRSCLTAKGVTP